MKGLGEKWRRAVCKIGGEEKGEKMKRRRRKLGRGGERSCVLIPEDLLPREERLHKGRELLLYKREMEPCSSLQKEKNNHQRTFLVHNVQDRQEQIVSQKS